MTLRSPDHRGFKASSRLIVTGVLSASMLMTTACGTQGFGVGRNPLGHGEKPVNIVDSPKNAQIFDGNPDKLNALFLRSKAKNLLAPGQTLPLDVIAIDRDGKRIDPSKLKLKFSSSKNENVSIDGQGVLTGIIPFESSEIKVVDETSGASAVVDVTVGPREFTGNPEALASLSLVLRQQAVPGKGESAQFQVVAKDILGNPIDPARLRLEWTVSDPATFEIDKNGEATALGSTGTSNVIVRDTVTGRVTTGTIRTIGLSDSPPVIPKGSGNSTGTTDPIPSGQPGVPATPSGPSQGNGPIEPAPVNNGTPSKAARIMLTPAVSDVRPGDRVQLSVTLFDDQGRAIDPNTVSLQWVSTESTLPVDQTGTVTAQAENKTTRVTVSVPGTSLSASAIVNSLAYTNTGGGGGGGGGTGGGGGLPPVVPATPLIPSTFSRPLSTSSFNVTIIPPNDSPEPIKEFRVTVGNAPGAPTFIVPATGGTVVAPVPPGALLNPDTTYPYSVVAVGNNGNISGTVNSFGTTLLNLQPTNLLGGSKDFAGVIKIPVNTPFPMNTTKGNALGTGDASPGETLAVTLQPTAANFGTVSLSGPAPGGVTVTGAGTFASPLVISGPKDLVNDTLNLFVYTPTAAFVGDATVTMKTSDTIEGILTPDDTDTLIFSVQAAAPAAPQNLMNLNPVFSGLTTTVNSPITLNPLNNDELGVKDDNGDTLTVTLTPTNGSFSLVAVPSGVTITGTGTAASPMVLTGSPFYINSALRGGLIFTPTGAFIGNATIRMQTSAPDGNDDDTVNINVIQPSNLYNGSATFPVANQRMAKDATTTFDGGSNKALSVLYPPGTIVKVNLVLLDSAGNNPSLPANGTLAILGVNGAVTVTTPGGANGTQLVGPIAQVNALLAAGVMYSPVGGVTGNFKLRMNSVDTNNALLTDTNDILNLEVSAPPQNRYNNGIPLSAWPTVGGPGLQPLELGFDSPLTFAGFFGTPLSVVDTDSASVTVTLTPTSNGVLTRANTNPIPAGVTVAGLTATGGTPVTLPAGSTSPVTGTSVTPLVITGSPTQINAFLNNGIVFTPTVGFSGAARVVMKSDDGGGTDTDNVDINVLPPPENNRNSLANFALSPTVPAAPTVAAQMTSPNEITGSLDNRKLTIKNYPSGASNIEVTLNVPKGAMSFASATGGVTETITNAGKDVLLVGSQANINTHLLKLRYTPAALAVVGTPETVTLTMNSTGGSLGDNGDTVSFLVSDPPLNSYKTSTVDANFPPVGTPLDIFSDQALLLNNTATATQPATALNVVDDSANVTVTLTPANTGGNTAAKFDLTAVPVGAATQSGAGTNASPLILTGPKADVQATMNLLRYTPQTSFTGPTSFTVVSSDGGPTSTNDTNNVFLNVRALPQNEFNTTTTTFPGTAIPMVLGIANPIADDGTGVNPAVHEIGVRNLSSYVTGQTATVRLQIPTGTLNVTLSGGVTITAGANGTNDLTLSATFPNITNINTVLGTLTWTPPAKADGDLTVPTDTLTMTHGPIPDTDTLILQSTRPPRNLYNALAAFPAARRIVNEGTPLTFAAAPDLVTVGSQTVELVEDSPAIRVTLTPSLVGGSNSGTVDVTPSGAATKSGAGTNASPLVINGTPTDVNATLATLTFNSGAGINGNAQIDMVTTDFAARDNNDSILLDVRARPSNRSTLNNVTSNTFPGTGSPRNVPVNQAYLLDGSGTAGNANDHPRVQVQFYGATDTVTVNLSLTPGTGTLQVTSTTSTVTGNSTTALQLVGTPAQVNADLATLIYNANNTAGNVDMQMLSTNGTVGDNTANQDVIRFNVQNQAPVNNLTGTTSGFVQGATTLPLKLVSDTTTVDDRLDFGQVDPTSAAAGNFTVTANTWPTLSISDDDTTLTTTVAPPAFGSLDDRLGTSFAGTGVTFNTAGSSFQFTGTVAQINAALLRLSFIPNANVANGTTGNIVITTRDSIGVPQQDVDNINILVERPTVPSTFSSNPNPSGTVFRAVYQFGRDKLPQIVVNDITVSGPELQAGAQIEIIRYNDNDPTTTADDDTDVIRTVTLNAPNAALGESVSFNNQTNRATVTVNFSAATSPVLSVPPAGSPVLNEGTGKLGGRLVSGNVDTPSASSTTAANHPYFYFVFPERTQYAVEDYFSGATNRGRWYLINTSSSVGAGSGRLSMLYDSASPLNIQNGTNNIGDVTAGLAKNPINGDVYYIDQEGTSPNFTSRLIRWIPSLGIQDGASTGDPFLPRGVLSFSNGLGLSTNFGDKPARLTFNSTVSGGTKTATLYASNAFEEADGQGELSGFYRITNFEAGAPTPEHIRLVLGGESFGHTIAYLNNGDLAFEPDTDAGAGVSDNRMFVTTNNKLYVSSAPVPNSGTADITVTEMVLPAGVKDILTTTGAAGGTAANQLVGLSIDGNWSAGARSLLVVARYPAPATTVARLYRLDYDATYNVTGATLLSNGSYDATYTATSFNPAGPIPIVDITSAHLP